MNEAELQAQVMGFADRYTARIVHAFDEYDALKPSPKNRRLVLSDFVHSIAFAFIIAAAPNPDIALLDMVVMVTMGRMIYEEHWRKEFGSEVEPMIIGFRTAEKDIWQLADQVLNPEQHKKLYDLIVEWRREHPEALVFSLIRFSEFAAERNKSSLAKDRKVGFFFKSVDEATQEVERVRLLAERGIFLATRLPLLTGTFADLWMSQLTENPELKEMLTSLHRFVDVAENLPQNFARERKALVEHAMDRLAQERKNTINDFLAQEARLKGVLTDIKQAATESNKLMISLNSFTEYLESESPENSEPFVINDYKETVAEIAEAGSQLNSLVDSLDRFLNSPGMEKLLPEIEEAIRQAGDEGEVLIDHSFRQAALLYRLS